MKFYTLLKPIQVRTMTNVKIFNLITRLHQKTEAGEIKWEATARPDRYLTSSADYSIVIASAEEQNDYYLMIVNEWDELIESISDRELRDTAPEAYHVMKSLFSMARRNARGADKAIDDILDSLG